jgi:protein-S-isoprenylcysteine O-methyltransferase Ste14
MTTPSEVGAPETVKAGRGVAVKLVAAWIILPLLFLATGGSLAWWQAWVYCAVLLVPMSIFLIHMSRHDPQFLARRSKVREKERAQRSIQTWGSLVFVAVLILPGIDHRLGWSSPPLAAQLAATVLALLSYLAILRVFLENRWAGRTVETFAEQKVIATGPYAIVRHPMYTGTLALYLATPVALGSWWAALPVIALVPMFVLRIRNEEEVMLRELRGYEEYRRKVRYRLVPFVW